MKHVALLVLVMLALGCKDKNDLCSRAVNHVFELLVFGEVSGEERKVINLARDGAIRRCRSEGLTEAQAACLFATRGPDWDDTLRVCPAFAARPSTWVTLRPPREHRVGLMGDTPTPDGPREGPRSYPVMVGASDSTCALDEAGAILCWGQPVATPPGTFTVLRVDHDLVCGLDRESKVQCAPIGDTPTQVPFELLTDFAIARNHGCGLRKQDGTIACWSYLNEMPYQPPPDPSVQVVMGFDFGCAVGLDERARCFAGDATAPTPPPDVRFRSLAAADSTICGITIDGAITCFGDNTRHLAPPPGTFRALDCRRGHCCGIKDDQTLACWGAPHEVYDPPSGTFSSVMVSIRHACAVRATGGTICWGNNDSGACNVPQAR